MPWDEAARLAHLLAQDPSTYVAAAGLGWKYPISHEAIILADLFDLQNAKATDKKDRHSLKPYPRPFSTDPREVIADTGQRSDDEIAALMAKFGHTLTLN